MKRIRLILTTLLLVVSATVFAQQTIQVKGVVKDAATGEGIPFAAIQLKGTMTGVATDAEGNYTIAVPGDGVLVFSSVGYQTAEIPVNGRSVIDVALNVDAEYLEDVIVVAYGTSTKASFTGSASMVKSEEIQKKITTNVTSALAGTSPGVQIISSSGDPTSNAATIRIRGVGSMSASNSPLIVVDGAPFAGAISDINPNDVESMSVLKDASAAAIYGNRGANGVILITTKKGVGDAQIRFDARFGSNSRLIPKYDLIDDPTVMRHTTNLCLTSNSMQVIPKQRVMLMLTNHLLRPEQWRSRLPGIYHSRGSKVRWCQLQAEPQRDSRLFRR